MELMVFDSSMITVVNGQDTLFSDILERGTVKRFNEWDSYIMTIEPRGNVRIYTNDIPLYFPEDKFAVIPEVNMENYKQYADTLLLGETIQ
jgi:hypothetical protein